MHFHWSGEKGRGSEHAINGKLYSMEMHLVHFNRKYGNISNAMTKEDGLAVIGVFFDITRKRNLHMETVIDGIKEVRLEESKRINDDRRSINLDELLPNNLDLFYRYKGSLTTPNCYETVTWLVLSDTNDIGLKQIEVFRDLLNTKKIPLSDTYRDIQSTRDRKIEASQKPTHTSDGHGTASQIHSSSLIMPISMASSLLMLAKRHI